MQNRNRNLIAVDDEAMPDVNRRTRWRRPLVFVGVAFFLLVAVVAGGYWLLVGRYLEETDDA